MDGGSRTREYRGKMLLKLRKYTRCLGLFMGYSAGMASSIQTVEEPSPKDREIDERQKRELPTAELLQMEEETGRSNQFLEVLEKNRQLCIEQSEILFECFEDAKRILGKKLTFQEESHKEEPLEGGQDPETIYAQCMRLLLKGEKSHKEFSAAFTAYHDFCVELVRKNEALERRSVKK